MTEEKNGYKWTEEDSTLLKGELEKLKRNAKLLRDTSKEKEIDCREDTINQSIKYITELANHFHENQVEDTDEFRTSSDSYIKYVMEKFGKFED